MMMMIIIIMMIVIIIMILSSFSPLCTVSTHIYPRQTMSLGNK